MAGAWARRLSTGKADRGKDKEISRLEGLYRKGLRILHVDIFASRAELIDEHTIRN